MAAATHPVDAVTRDIAEYAANYRVDDEAALDAAHLCLIDTLGCAFEGLGNAACRKLLGPLFPLGEGARGARVPGTALDVDPMTAAFNIGCASRWLDFSDTYFGAQGSHPSDNIGGLLAISEYVSRRRRAAGGEPLRARELLEALVKAYEIQGVLSIENSLYDAGLDHVLLVKLATAAVATKLLGGGVAEAAAAVSNAWLDGHALSTYRRSPNAGTRKSWAGAEATAKGLFLAALAMRGEMAYPTALTAPGRGLYDVLFRGRPFAVPRAYGASIVKEIQFKVQVPTVFNSQTAAECAMHLHPQVRGRLDRIRRIVISAHETTLRLNATTGPLTTPADRDHCVQFIVAAALARGSLGAEDYEGARAADPVVERLRQRTEVVEERRYTDAYRDPAKRASANAVQVWFDDGSCTPRVELEYPLGHPGRRQEAVPLLMRKFAGNVARVFPRERRGRILDRVSRRSVMERLPVDELTALLAL
ncbi:MAG: bifunctional 2-methylcitrate dehydratase/aconitate hydratase [Burkholderiales bacterium]|nr:bifunctional 2-methylcitrate dehydratase/aconitate hydratase [Burkholderiales bacterium]